MKSIEERIKETPLSVRLKVSNQMDLMSFLTDMGYRGNQAWADDEKAQLRLLFDFANKMAGDQERIINEWIKDGKP